VSLGGVRLSAGALRGRRVNVPAGVRPTEGRVREALFSILGPAVRDGSFLDLFAGSGAVGLEAASRGAARVVAVDRDPGVLRDLRRTIGSLGLRVAVVRLELPRQLRRLETRGFDWVFADPPYAFDAYPALLAAIPSLLAAGGLAVVEHDARKELPASAPGLERDAVRRYGETALSFYSSPPSPRQR
jgi:16S rRNA (guanine966-N2)-methyltransferase